MQRTIQRTIAVLAIAFAAVTCSAIRTSAEVKLGAQEVIDQWIESTGGREAFDAEQTVHLKGRLNAASLRGTYELWLAKPDKWVSQIRLGSLHIREGYDGEIAWRTDLSARTVLELEGPELEHAREEAFFLHDRWADPDHGGASIRLGAHVYGAENAHRVLEVTPPEGHPRRLFVNLKTGFIDRVEALAGQYVHVERWSQYGKKDAHRHYRVVEWGYPRWNDHDPERLTIDSVIVDRPIDDAIFSPPELKQRKIAWLKTPGVARVPFKYGAKHVWVRVSVDGRPPADFILDTGASLTAFDRDWAYQNGLQPEGVSSVQGMGGTGEMSFARVKSLRLVAGKGDGVKLTDFRAALIDLGDLFEYTMWRRPMGLLGSDFLSRFVVEIDYDSNLVTLHDPETWTPREQSQAIDMKLIGGIPTVEMMLDDGCGGRFLVDVGNSSGVDMHGEAVRRCGLFRGLRRPRVEMWAGGIGGAFQVTMCRMDSLTLGPWTWNEPIIGLSLHGGGMVGSKDIAGNIGNGVLEKFRCTFDYPGNRLWLEPGKRFVSRDLLTRWGGMLVRLPERVIVASVIHDSPADEAGIKLFDEVLEIDGRPATTWTREQIDGQLEEGKIGTVHTLKIRRLFEDDSRRVEVTLRDVL